MAVETPNPIPETPHPTPASAAAAAAAPAAAPGRHQEFAVEPSRTALYRIYRGVFNDVMRLWFRPKVVGKENIPATGPVILAPVHRSFADFGFASFCTRRKLFFMTKDSMWEHKLLGRWLLYVGAFLSARTGAPIVPIGIGASDLAMPKGQVIPRPYRIEVVIGPAMAPPARTGGGRVSRSSVHAATEELVGRLQAVYDEAKAKTGRY